MDDKLSKYLENIGYEATGNETGPLVKCKECKDTGWLLTKIDEDGREYYTPCQCLLDKAERGKRYK